jgi:hypothetical protein
MPKISVLVEAAKASRRPAKAVEKITPEEFRERILTSVEKKG